MKEGENLIKNNSHEMINNTPPLSFLLDIDGVVTNPVEKKVTEPEIFDHIIENLASGNPVALNTGRSNEWMIERVITPLNTRVEDKSILKNFFAVGEKGLTWTSFDSNGQLIQGLFNRNGEPVQGYDLHNLFDQTTIDHFITLEKETRNLIDNKYKHSTFFDTTKKAMISTEMHDGYDQPQYAAEQVRFDEELNEMLNKLGLNGKFKTDPTTIATDIQIPEAGKHLGTKRILDWLSSNNLRPLHYVAVGDSSSDLEMGDELMAQGLSFDFNYVNPNKPLKPEQINMTDGKPKFNLINASKAFGNGLLETFERYKKTA